MWIQRRSGEIHQRGTLDHRDPYERDRTRVIHCPAFRRLQRKTQILGTDEGDFHRTRLTHSLEVASIGVSLVRNLKTKKNPDFLNAILPSDDLISTICLLHDIGHPPFGHGGEVALNYKMHAFGGFEGNAQTLRLLTKVEDSYGEFGLDLTRRTLLGILKYPAAISRLILEFPKQEKISQTIRINDWLPPKGYFDSENTEVDWILAPLSLEDKDLFQSLKRAPTTNKYGLTAFHSFDCSIMDIADDIAYGVHDLEDAIHLQLITRDQLVTEEFYNLLLNTPIEADHFLELLFNPSVSKRKEAIGSIVNFFIGATEVAATNDQFENLLLKYNLYMREDAKLFLDYLVSSVYQHIIDSQEARTFEYGGKRSFYVCLKPLAQILKVY